MSRPHEDRENHTLVDHRPGGDDVSFVVDSWYAIEIAHVKRTRIDAAISAYESMIEKSRATEADAGIAAVFSAVSDREILALCEVRGHDAYRRMASAWDDHHRFAAGHAVAESRTLGLYRVAQTLGDVSVVADASDAYIFERTPRNGLSERPARNDVTAALGFRGVVAFLSDDGNRSLLIYRFEHLDQFAAIRATSAAQTEHVRPVKTFS